MIKKVKTRKGDSETEQHLRKMSWKLVDAMTIPLLIASII